MQMRGPGFDSKKTVKISVCAYNPSTGDFVANSLAELAHAKQDRWLLRNEISDNHTFIMHIYAHM